jgi:hypothetical protein
MLAGAAITATGSAASTVVSQVIIRLLTGTFNPNYKKNDRRRMRYIQKKYAAAYRDSTSADDSTAIISAIGIIFVLFVHMILLFCTSCFNKYVLNITQK